MSSRGVTPYRFQRGEDITVPITDTEAAEADLGTIVGRMKALEPGARTLAADATAIAFDVYYRAASDDLAKGWTFNIPAARAITDAPTGYYLFNFAVVIDGVEVFKSDLVTILIEESAA